MGEGAINPAVSSFALDRGPSGRWVRMRADIKPRGSCNILGLQDLRTKPLCPAIGLIGWQRGGVRFEGRHGGEDAAIEIFN
jgi:hypothetical protein